MMDIWNLNWVILSQRIANGIDVSDLVGEIGQRPDWLNQYIITQIFDLAQDWCPVKTGRLKSTGRILRNSINTYSIQYSTPYAIYVHECENHHLAPTRSHWLEDAAYTIFNRLQPFGIYFTFSIDLDNSNVTLHLESMNQNDFDFNRNYGQYMSESFYDNKFHDIAPMRKSNLKIKTSSFNKSDTDLAFDEMG